METGKGNLKIKIRSSREVEPSQGNKYSESFKQTDATQFQELASVGAEDKSSKKESVILRKRKRKEQNVDKARNDGSVHRLPGSANQNDAKAPSKITQLMEGKRKKVSSHDLARKKRLELLRAKVERLKKESLRLSRELQRWATICMELQEQITKQRKFHEAKNGAGTPDAGKSVLAYIPQTHNSTFSSLV